jgi:hypothetical protein
VGDGSCLPVAVIVAIVAQDAWPDTAVYYLFLTPSAGIVSSHYLSLTWLSAGHISGKNPSNRMCQVILLVCVIHKNARSDTFVPVLYRTFSTWVWCTNIGRRLWDVYEYFGFRFYEIHSDRGFESRSRNGIILCCVVLSCESRVPTIGRADPTVQEVPSNVQAFHCFRINSIEI